MTVEEYNTLNLVKENTKKKTTVCCTIIFEMKEKYHNVLFQPRRNSDFEVYVQSFRLIQ